jgi:hypothetical protein
VDATPFVRQLAWREFYQHQAFHHRTDVGTPVDPLAAAFRPGAEAPDAVAASTGASASATSCAI